MDAVIKSRYHYQPHTGVVSHETTQPSEQLILERNAELRKNPGAVKDMSFGRQVASIPIIMYEAAIRAGYDLNSHDHKFAGTEMNRFLQSTEGKMCLIQAPREGRKIIT